MDIMELFGVDWVVGVGKYAADRAKAILKQRCVDRKLVKKTSDVETFLVSQSSEAGGGEREVRVCSIMHPSPINPAANVDWAGKVKGQLESLGVLPFITT